MYTFLYTVHKPQAAIRNALNFTFFTKCDTVQYTRILVPSVSQSHCHIVISSRFAAGRSQRLAIHPVTTWTYPRCKVPTFYIQVRWTASRSLGPRTASRTSWASEPAPREVWVCGRE